MLQTSLFFFVQLLEVEAEKQIEKAGEYPDTVIACFGGGSNFGGLAFPFMRHNILNGKQTEFIAAEPASCPKLTRGQFRYDFGDEAGYTPLLPMFTLGHNFKPSNIHAGGLRYHGAGVIVSQLLKDGMMRGEDIPQLESFDAGMLFARTEGIVPAPESCHAIAATIREANKCKETGEEKNIVFGLTGTGYFDMYAYEKFHNGDMTDYVPTDEELEKAFARLPEVKGTAGTAAFVLDEVTKISSAYRWTLNHTVEVDDPLELFPITMIDVE